MTDDETVCMNRRDLRAIKGLLLAIIALVVVAASTVGFTVIVTVADVDSLQNETLLREEVCTRSNPGACVALFNRMAANISDRQRRRLACDVLSYFESVEPTLNRATTARRCPGRLPSP